MKPHVDDSQPDPDVLPIVEETVTVGRRSVQSGRVRVSTVTERVDAIVETLLATSSVEVTRVPVGREIDTVPEIRTEGEVTVIPVVEEVPVVVRRLVLREEIHIKRHRSETSVEVPVQLRKQRAIVTREGHDPDIEREQPMTDYGTRNLTAFFDNRGEAEAAVARLQELQLGTASIRIAGGDEYAQRTDVEDRGFWESISDFFFPSEERSTYAEGLRRGGYLVTVGNVPEADYDRVLDILDDAGSIDLDERVDSWRAEGWSGSSASAATTGAGASMAAGGGFSDSARDQSAEFGEADRLGSSDEEVIPVIEEQLRVGKRDVDRGRVRVRAYVVEQPISEDVTLHDERVEIERRPVDRVLDQGEAAFTDRTIEAEERSEEAVVSKDARVTEEISLRRRAEERTETVSDTVRHTEVEVEDERTGVLKDHDTRR